MVGLLRASRVLRFRETAKNFWLGRNSLWNRQCALGLTEPTAHAKANVATGEYAFVRTH